MQSCQDVEMTDETKVENVEIQNKILWLRNRVKNQNLLEGFPYETDLEKCKNEPELTFWAIIMRNTIDDCPREILQKACFNCCVDCGIWKIAKIY